MPTLSTPLEGSGWRREIKQILLLAVPLAAAQLAQMLMGVTDAVMMGRVGTSALAAGGLASSIGFLLILMCQGLVQSIQPIVAQARGAGDHSQFAVTLAAGFVLATITAVPILAVVTKMATVLSVLGEPGDIAELAGGYATALAWGIPAAMWQAVMRNYIAALGRTRIIMVVAIMACLMNFVLNWALIFGHLLLPRLGLPGAGYATALSWWTMDFAFAFYLYATGLLPAGLFQLTIREIRRGLQPLIEIGWPIAAVWGVEVGFFSGSALLVGRFGPVALATHQICINLCSLTFMIPLALSTAASIRVGYHIGAGAAADAGRAGYTALVLAGAFMSVAAVLIWSFPDRIIGFYVEESDPNLAAVTRLGTPLLMLAAAFQVFDGVQTVAAGSLRGLKDTRAALVLGVVGYWVLGLPIGTTLAFRVSLGPVGMWWGFLISLVVVAVSLTLRFRYRIDALVGGVSSAQLLRADG